MKAIKKEITTKGHVILTCQDSVLFGLIKREVRFIATEEISKGGGFWDWRKLPNKTLIADRLSFQLDAWYKDFEQLK